MNKNGKLSVYVHLVGGERVMISDNETQESFKELVEVLKRDNGKALICLNSSKNYIIPYDKILYIDTKINV